MVAGVFMVFYLLSKLTETKIPMFPTWNVSGRLEPVKATYLQRPSYSDLTTGQEPEEDCACAEAGVNQQTL